LRENLGHLEREAGADTTHPSWRKIGPSWEPCPALARIVPMSTWGGSTNILARRNGGHARRRYAHKYELGGTPSLGCSYAPIVVSDIGKGFLLLSAALRFGVCRPAFVNCRKSARRNRERWHWPAVSKERRCGHQKMALESLAANAHNDGVAARDLVAGI